MLPEGRRVEAVIGPDQVVAKLNVHVANCEIPFPPNVQRVLHEAAAFDFYFLPPTLAGDLAFVRLKVAVAVDVVHELVLLRVGNRRRPVHVGAVGVSAAASSPAVDPGSA